MQTVSTKAAWTRCSCGEYVRTSALQLHKLLAHPEQFSLPCNVKYSEKR